MKHVVVREYARLTTKDVSPSLDQATVSESAFLWLSEVFGRSIAGGARLVTLEGQSWLRLDNYVGLIETPDGTQIEILPKVADLVTDAVSTRALMMRMLCSAYNLPSRTFGSAHVQAIPTSIWEWTASQFIEQLQVLIRRGLRSEYQVVNGDEPYLRGRLRIDRQSLKPPWRLQDFSVEFDELSMQTPENRLIRSALDVLQPSFSLSSNIRRSLKEADSRLAAIARSGDIDRDLGKWSTDRLSTHYRDIRPWCELVLRESNPIATAGSHRAPSLLFPMERLFEAFVARSLHRSLPKSATVRTQVKFKSLCELAGRSLFQLRPDILVENEGARIVFDTKWKKASGDSDKKYGISQADMYQLFAYGHKYLSGVGDVCLIYPKTAAFSEAIGPFRFSATLNAYAIPFDLKTETACLHPSLGAALHAPAS